MGSTELADSLIRLAATSERVRAPWKGGAMKKLASTLFRDKLDRLKA